MRQTYGKDAEIHCMYSIRNNEENPTNRDYWYKVKWWLDDPKLDEEVR